MTDDLPDLTISQCQQLLEQRQVSALELTQVYLKAIERLEPLVRSFITLTPELALERARVADVKLASGAGGPLTGVPMQMKDALSTRGVPTTCGSRMLEDFVPPYDARVVERLYEQDAVLLGKGIWTSLPWDRPPKTPPFTPPTTLGTWREYPAGAVGEGLLRWLPVSVSMLSVPTPGAACASPRPCVAWWG